MYTPRARGHNSVLGAPTIKLPQILTIDEGESQIWRTLPLRIHRAFWQP